MRSNDSDAHRNSETDINANGQARNYILQEPQDKNSVHPEYAGSNGIAVQLVPPRPAPNLPKFPRLKTLVMDEDNTNLLAALLPSLDKYKCLQSLEFQGRQSPWVRSFCDLYHDAGPWGASKFSNSLIESAHFDRVASIYQHLKMYKGECDVHTELLRRLAEFFDKKEYYENFIKGCKEIAEHEMQKPKKNRAAIPSAATSTNILAHVPSCSQDATKRQRSESNDVIAISATPKRNCKSDHYHQKSIKEKREQLLSLLQDRYDIGKGDTASATLSAKIISKIDNLDEKMMQSILRESDDNTGNASSKRQKTGNQNGDDSNIATILERQESITKKRVKLVSLLKVRNDFSKNHGRNDGVTAKISLSIDSLDEERMNLILGGDGDDEETLEI